MNQIKRLVLSSRFWLHCLFWFLVFMYMIIYGAPTFLALFNLNLFVVATYCAHWLLINRFYVHKKYRQFVIYFLLFVLLYALFAQVLYGVLYKYQLIKEQEEFPYVLLAFFVLVTFTSSIKIARFSYKREVVYTKAQNEQLQAELSLLKAQINPHFLFNSLNNLYGMVLQNRNQQASEMILRLSDLMRYVLESNQQKQTSLDAEIKFIQNYLALEKTRLSQEVDIQFEIALSNRHSEIPPLLFIPMVENVFKHGINQHTLASFAHFSLSLQDNQLFFEARNSISHHPLAERQKSGTGLLNLQKRLEIAYPQKHTLSIEQDKKTYQVTLFIEL